eukprot:396386-Amphidinium_carterae.2
MLCRAHSLHGPPIATQDLMTQKNSEKNLTSSTLGVGDTRRTRRLRSVGLRANLSHSFQQLQSTR